MANHVGPGAMPGAASETATQEAATMHSGTTSHNEIAARLGPAALGPFPPYHGRRVSWIAVSIIMAGFLVGGLALIFGSHGPTWWLFWVGSGLAAVGLLTSIATNTFEDWY